MLGVLREWKFLPAIRYRPLTPIGQCGRWRVTLQGALLIDLTCRLRTLTTANLQAACRVLSCGSSVTTARPELPPIVENSSIRQPACRSVGRLSEMVSNDMKIKQRLEKLQLDPDILRYTSTDRLPRASLHRSVRESILTEGRLAEVETFTGHDNTTWVRPHKDGISTFLPLSAKGGRLLHSYDIFKGSPCCLLKHNGQLSSNLQLLQDTVFGRMSALHFSIQPSQEMSLVDFEEKFLQLIDHTQPCPFLEAGGESTKSWDSDFEPPVSQQVAVCLLALQHYGKSLRDPAIAYKVWIAYQHVQLSGLGFHQLLHSSICNRALAVALDAYPEQEDDGLNLFADGAKWQLAEVLDYQPKYVTSAASSDSEV